MKKKVSRSSALSFHVQRGLTLMELLVAVGLSVLVIAGVSTITSFVAKRFHDSGADQAKADSFARITTRLAREFDEVVAWHILRPDQLVYTSSFVAAGEENQPYSTSLVCQQIGTDKLFSLVYQRMPPISTGPGAISPGGKGAKSSPLMEVPIASHLSKCAIEFGVFTATEANEQKTVQWVNRLAPADLEHVTHMRITMADGGGTLPPINIARRKR